MEVYDIPSTTVKKFQTKSSGTTTMAPCFDEGNSRCGFRLKRRYYSCASISKDATDRKRRCFEAHRNSSCDGSDCNEPVIRTPCTAKLIVVLPELRLPFLGDDDRMPMTRTKHRSDSMDCSSVFLNLSELFDAVADIPELIEGA